MKSIRRDHSLRKQNHRPSTARKGTPSNKLALQLVCCFLVFSMVKNEEMIPQSSVRDTVDALIEYGSTDYTFQEAAAALSTAAGRLQVAPTVAMVWPCNEVDSLALASSSSSKVYSFTSELEEMQVFSSCGGTVTNVLEGRIVISHGNGLETIYEGCTDVYVQPLQKVRKGELIASIRGEERKPQLTFQILKEQQAVDIGDYLYEN